MGHRVGNALNDKLEPKVVTIALIVGLIEFETFTLAKGVIKYAQQDAWISILLGGLIGSVATYVMVKLAARFPGENLFQLNKKVWGKIPAFIISLLFIVYWAVYLSLLFNDTSYTNRFFFLKNTPRIVTLIFLIIGASWLVVYGLTAVIRFFQIQFLFLVIPLLFIYVLAIIKIELSNFLPVLSNGIVPVLKGALYYAGALQGLELILFLGPFLTDVKKAVKPALLGVGFVAFTSIWQALAAIGIMGVDFVEGEFYPGIQTVTLIELPGFPVERFGLILTLPLFIGVFTTICLFVYLLSYGLMQTFNLQQKKLVVWLASAVTGLATFAVTNVAFTLKMREYFFIATLFFVYLIPLLTLILAVLRRKKGGSFE